MAVSNLVAKVRERRPGVSGDSRKLIAPVFLNEVSDQHSRIFAHCKGFVKSRLCITSIPLRKEKRLNNRMDRYKNRRRWLKELKEQEGSVAALATKIETDPNYLSSLLGPSSKRNVGDEIAMRAEDVYKLPRGALDLPSVLSLSLVREAVGMSNEDIEDVIRFMHYKKSGKT